ncbi:MAG: ABC transporter permease [Bryobacterales bacterium]|nr:ABC transporter permease [Bryobacterales bacterium]
MWKDFVYTFRTLRRSPVFTAAAVLSLALGIGANAAIFSLLDQVLLRLLPVHEPERLVVLHTEYASPGSSQTDNYESVFSYPMYKDLLARDPAFDGVLARSGARAVLSFQNNADPVSVELVSGNFFQVLGVGADLGRVFTSEEEGAPGANPVVVLDSGFWSRRFGGNLALLGQTVTINGNPMVIAGVAARRFKGILPGNTPDLYVPISMKRVITPTFEGLEDLRMRWLNLFARVKPGFTPEKAQAATSAIYRAILEAYAPRMGIGGGRARDEFLNHRVELKPASQGINSLRRQWEKPLVVLMAMAGLILLIACANVAGLMLARASGRQREIAIRLALGAKRRTLVKQLLVEGLTLALAGGALGLLVAHWSAYALIHLLPGDSAGTWLTATLDWRLVGFNLALCLTSALLCALIPALQATRSGVAETLKGHATGVASGGGQARLRKVVVTAQLSLSLLLVVAAGLFSSSLGHLMNVDLGFRSERLLQFSLDASISRPKLPAALAFYQEVIDRLAQPGDVSGVGAAAGGPFSGGDRGGNLTVEGYDAKPEEYVGSSLVAASPGFFRTMGIPLRAGREFTARDNASAPKVVVVNEAFVKRYFKGRDPLGRRLMFGASNKPDLDREIVGVVSDFRKEVRKPAKEALYFPYAQWETPERLTFYVRANGDEGRQSAAIRQLVRSLDPGVPVRDLKATAVRVRDSIYGDRLIALLSVAFGTLATVLAALGIYGLVAHSVARRTAEIGIRMALGARSSDVLRLVLKEAVRMAAVGITIGLAGAVALGRLVESQLFGMKGADPSILAGAAALLAAIVLLAALLPAKRAAAINPVTALKYE